MADPNAGARNNGLRWLWLVPPLVLLDQLTKWWAEAVLVDGPIAVMPGLNFSLAYNPGAAFSFLADAGGWQRGFFIVVTILISAFLLYWLSKGEARRPMLGCSLALVLSGAVGNFIDRLMRGPVVDFIDVYYQSWHWPTFNVADSAITIGVVLLIVDTIRHPSASAD